MVVIDDWLDSLKCPHSTVHSSGALFWLALCHSVVRLPSLCLCVIQQLINWSGRPVGSGVDYPVRKGCSKYDFTMEQIEQKKKKRTRIVSVSVCLCLCSVREGRGCVRACVCVCVCVHVYVCVGRRCVCMCAHVCVCVCVHACVCVCAHAASDS